MPGTGCKSIAQDCMQVLRIFVSETRQKRSQKYLVSESWGAPYSPVGRKPFAGFKHTRIRN